MACREAYTTTATQAVVDYLVNDRDLQFDQEAERDSTLAAHADLKIGATQALRTVPEPGKIVFAYRKTPPFPTAARWDQATFSRTSYSA